MKILCENCNKEIEFVILESLVSERQARCGFCSATFIIRPKGEKNAGFEVIFDLEKRTVRTCISCGKQFYSPPDEAIPVCPVCKNEIPEPEYEMNKYYVLKSTGNKLGPFMLEELGKMIRGGQLVESDMVEPPEKNRLMAKDVPELTPYFQGFYQQKKKVEQTSPSKIVRSPHSFNISYTVIVSIFLILCFIYWVHLIFRAEEKQPVKKPNQTKMLLEEWSKKFTAGSDSYDRYFNLGMDGLQTYTELSCYQAKNNFIRAFIKGGGSSSALPYVTLALACIYDFDKDSKTAELALNLADLAINESPLTNTGYLAKGDMLYKIGKVDESAQMIEKGYLLSPENALSIILKGRALLNSKERAKEGINLLQKGLKLDPDFSYANFLIAEDAYRNEEFATALHEVNARLEKSPADAQALFLRAELNLPIRKYSSVINDLVSILKTNPNNTKARVLLTILSYRTNGGISEAAREIRFATRKGNNLAKSEIADLHLLQSTILLKMKKFTEAISECDSGLSLKPTDPYLKINKIDALLSVKDVAQTSILIQDFLVGESSNPEEVIFHLIELFERHKMKTELEELLVKYTQSESRTFYPFVKLAILYFEKQDMENAKSVLIDGMEKSALTNLSQINFDYRASKLAFDPKDLGKELEKASKLSINPELIETAKGILLFQGRLGESPRNNLEASKKIFEKVIKKDENIIHAFIYLGYANLLLGRNQKAEELLKKAGELNINSAAIKFFMGVLYARQDKFDKARASFKEALELGWPNYLMLFELGNLEKANRNKTEALKKFRDCLKAQPNFLPVLLTLYKIEREG